MNKNPKNFNKEYPTISVIMAVHNSQRFLEKSIKSIINQTFNDFELIIINDFSKDKSLDLAKEYRKRDKRIIIFNNKKNMGPAKTRNKGLNKAKGKYIAILDSDDISHPKRLEIQFKYLEKHPETFLVGSSAVFIDENGNEIKRFRKYKNSEILSWRLPKSCSIIHSSVMFRNHKKIFYDVQYKYAHDYAFYLELLSKNKKLINLPNFLVKYRVSRNSISVDKRKEQEHFRNLIKKRYKDLANKNYSLFRRIYFSLFLLFFYLRTLPEKKGI